MFCINNVVAGISVYAEGCNVTGWFSAANVTDDKAFSGVVITKKNTTQIGLAFKSGKVT